MVSKSDLILAVAPTEAMAAQAHGLTLAHMAYRVGAGPHLFRSNLPIPTRGGLMLIDDDDFDGGGKSSPFCQEVARECAARGYAGAIFDFDRSLPLLRQIVSELAPLLRRQGLPLYVSEAYGQASSIARVLIPSALSGGSLRRRLEEAVSRYGAERVVLAVERVREDFFLPSPTGQGIPMSREDLEKRIAEKSPAIFFSNELCAHYFTYMNRRDGAHFILFDDASSIRHKLKLARSLEIGEAILPYADTADLLPEILA